jgi:ABC-2 type transport system ATP-binding protein
VSEQPAVQVERLSRSYVTRRGLLRRTQRVIQALREVSFEVEPGELFGLLGPNGAGKTTTVRVLSTLLLPDSGTVRVLGLDVAREARALRRQIGFLFGGDRGLYGRVSAWDNLRYFANLHGLPTSVSGRRIEELLELVGLRDRARDLVQTYSRGMKQRLHIARALLNDPRVLYLDEPTIGLDPVGAREIRGLIASLTAQGRTVLLTTHYMAEAEELCRRVAIINHGRIAAIGPPRELHRLAADLYVLEIELAETTPELVQALERLGGRESRVQVEQVDGRQRVHLHSARARELLAEALVVLSGHPVTSVSVREPSLEDVYVRLVTAPAEGDGAPVGS